MLVKVCDLLPNPFRHMDRYPIRRDKVEALRESLRKTGFWDNVVARQHDGQVEIAYGHHRLVALQEEYGPDQEVSVILRDLDDARMLQIMAAENMEEWGSSAWVEMETVASVLQAYADGKIGLEPPALKTSDSGLRYANDQGRSHPYTPATVADFLGWHEPSGSPSYKVTTAIAALDLIAQGVLAEPDFAGLGTKQVQHLVRQTRRALRDKEAERIRKEAEAQQRAAKAAERERERAEAERKRQEEAEARARDEAVRAEANRKRIEAERQAEEARKREEQAQRRAEAEKQRAAEQEQKGRAAATRVGRHVSQKLQSGEIGYMGAAEAADEVMPEREPAPKRMDAHALKVAQSIWKIMRDDQLKKYVDELVKFRDQLSPERRSDLAINLREAADRFAAAAGQFGSAAENGRVPQRDVAPMLVAAHRGEQE